ncbi:MAG: HU family DNA-binding protein [Wolbachia sp.]|nr:HU family DNA-binding protein [Wolbachia sp.]
MSKEDIIKKLKEKCSEKHIGATKSDLNKIFDALMEVMKDVLNDTGEMRLHGIGTFCIMISKEKQCRNPQNGEVMIVPEKRRVKFKVSQTLAGVLNEKEEEAVN